MGNYNNERYQMKDQYERVLPAKITSLDEKIAAVTKDVTYLESRVISDKDDFEITVEDERYEERTEAGEALLKAIIRNGREDNFVKIAEYSGFDILSRSHKFSEEADLKICRESTMIIESSDSPLGVVSRIKNAIQNLPKRLTHMQESKKSIEADMKRIKMQLDVPFDKAGKRTTE